MLTLLTKFCAALWSYIKIAYHVSNCICRTNTNNQVKHNFQRLVPVILIDKNTAIIQSDFNGLNTFGTMKIYVRDRGSSS